MSKNKELNFSVEDVEKVETIDIDEFNKKVEELTKLGKYFDSIGAFVVTLWSDSKLKVDIQTEDNSILAEYLKKNEKLIIRDIGGFDRYGIEKGNLEICYLKPKTKKSRLK
jgi:hypothetical protein|uniref:Uncharacterized protein n=1 Tax=Siphoviridae sp. ctb3910 TaxID=2827897 RepID=A0A8S5S8J9_9CAUD|nr:MAG TPA: hypothetical protein [Siphoviridae sp. ctb3910]